MDAVADTPLRCTYAEPCRHPAFHDRVYGPEAEGARAQLGQIEGGWASWCR